MSNTMKNQVTMFVIRNREGNYWTGNSGSTPQVWGPLENAFRWENRRLCSNVCERSDGEVVVEIGPDGVPVNPPDLLARKTEIEAKKTKDSYVRAGEIISNGVKAGNFKEEAFRFYLAECLDLFADHAVRQSAKASPGEIGAAVAAARGEWLQELKKVEEKAKEAGKALTALEKALSAAGYVIQGKAQ